LSLRVFEDCQFKKLAGIRDYTGAGLKKHRKWSYKILSYNSKPVGCKFILLDFPGIYL